MDLSLSAGGGSPFGDIPTRPMRVKILYTFDDENKTNCLARFPDILQVPAVPIDDTTQIGVIELRQCIQAIVSASPELISRLTQGDFTIYAYDYSEYETPLVGQGMLSALLAAVSPTPSAPAHQSKTMITGRVCKNIMALFNNGVSETLEVKLRLVPVPKPVQLDFLKSMESFRTLSPAMSGGFDPNAWTASFQHNQVQARGNEYFNVEGMDEVGGETGDQMVDEIFGQGSGSSGSNSGREYSAGVGAPVTPTGTSFAGFNPAFATQSHSAPGSRAGSPMMAPESSNFNSNLRHQSFHGNTTTFADHSRPASRASNPSEGHASQGKRQAPTLSPQPTQQSESNNEVYYNEDGAQRKRAKVMQADWRGRSSFGGKHSDLRVTAATAASVHMHRPIATRSAAPGSNLEPPPRVPTPVPQNGRSWQSNRPTAPARSMLRQASTVASEYGSDAEIMSDALMSSPEDRTNDGSSGGDPSPQDIPSSPPIFVGNNSPQPSSPGLPTLQSVSHHNADSGYMSGGFIGQLDDDNGSCSPEYQDPGSAPQYQSRDQQPFVKSEGVSGGEHYAGNQGMLGSDALLPSFEQRQAGVMGNAAHQGQQGNNWSHPSQAHRMPSRPTLQHTATAPPVTSQHQGLAPPLSRRSSLAPPSLPAQAPAGGAWTSVNGAPQPANKPGMRRAYTTANYSESGSPAPSDNESVTSRSMARGGRGTARRKLLEQRLEDCIAKGEMPRFCQHCGAIETPTWRKIYVEEFQGKPGPLEYVEGENETIGVEVIERNEEGESTKFVIRKSMKKTRSKRPAPSAQEVLVCNPCGLWFNKTREMRPPEKWARKVATRKSKKPMQDGGFPSGFATDSMEPPSDAFFTDQVLPDEPIAAANPNIDPSLMGGTGNTATDPVGALPPAPAMQRPRANSMQAQQTRPPSQGAEWSGAQRNAALARAIQSSPARFQGTQHSPIELDELTPKPTRRMLFPSPRNEGQMKSLDDGAIITRRSASPSDEKLLRASDKPFSPPKNIDGIAADGNPGVFETFTVQDKENVPPPLDGDDDFADLFGSPISNFKTPRKTPPSKQTPQRASQRQIDNLLKTPTPASRKRKPLTPSAAAANNATIFNPANDFMTSPATARYFLRSTPTRANATPASRSSAANSNGNEGSVVSPFTRHLRQMLSDSNGNGVDDGMGQFTSPSRAGENFDYSDLPTFDTPGRLGEGVDWEGLEGLLGSSDFNLPEGDGNGAVDQSNNGQ